jgi:hypothetical protein
MSDFLYPINFNFKVPKTGVKLFLDIFKSGDDYAELVGSANGGLFFDQNSSPVFFSYTSNLPVGKYFGRLTSKEYPAFVVGPTDPGPTDPGPPGPTDIKPNPELATTIKFAKPVFTGFEGIGLTAEIVRSGFTEYPFGITVFASFPSEQSNPYLNLDYPGFNSSGFFVWTGEIKENFQIKLPIFNNNKWENDVNGKLEFFIDSRGFPSGSINTSNRIANFVIIDDDIPECVKQCYSSSLPSSSPSSDTQGLGLDFFFEY